jgi:hypothetical protein
VEEALKSLESSGGYAILLGLMLVGIFYLAQRYVDTAAKRSAAREERTRAEFAIQLEHERQNAQNYQSTTERMIDVVEANTGAITTLVETIRPMVATLALIDRHIGHEGKREEKRA